jgi:hypothetical protein
LFEDRHFPFLVHLSASQWKNTDVASDARRRNARKAGVKDKAYGASRDGIEESDEQRRFHCSLSARRDSSSIALPNNRGPGPDLAMWIGSDALIVIGVQTSMTTHVTPGIQKKNYRSTAPNYWWATNEGCKRRHIATRSGGSAWRWRNCSTTPNNSG